MSNHAVQILWDSSYLWGVMAWNAMRAFGLPCHLVKADEIAQGSLQGKPWPVLLVPGGSARQKAEKLGPQGLEAIRQWVWTGGAYFGFCGGCGLALSGPDANASLNLCPWERHPYTNRFYHLISGHVYADTGNGKIKVPVWWPGRFEAGRKNDIQILASYSEPCADLWLADLPLADIPRPMREKWHENGQLDINLHLPKGQPLIISGKYGKGKWLLSYAHLETPDSPQANKLLRLLLAEIAGLDPDSRPVSSWHWQNPVLNNAKRPSQSQRQKEAGAISRKLLDLFRLGTKMGFFLPRTDWLWGWRAGAPGIICNHLLACSSMLASLPDGHNRLWRLHGQEVLEMADEFIQKAESYFWKCRLASALAATGGDSLPNNEQEKKLIFGAPMQGGGLAQTLLDALSEQLYDAQRPDSTQA